MGETSQNMGYSNKIRVTGTNHADQPGGKFFNFELRKTDLPWEPCGELPDGTPFGEVRLKVWNSRTEREHDVVAWDAPNGGERQGDAHGRCEPDDDEEVFEGGDKLYIIGPKRKAEIEFAPCGELPDGTPFGEANFQVRNCRTGEEYDVVAWDAPNGGRGDAHGRRCDEGDGWVEANDRLAIIGWD